MTYLVDKLRLAERAKEDIYFARLDRELIEALHQKALLNRRFQCDLSVDKDSPAKHNTESENTTPPNTHH